MANRDDGVLLDTSVVVAHLRRKLDVIELTKSAGPLFLPLVALGELYKGAERSTRTLYNRQLIDDFLEITTLLFPSRATAQVYAGIATTLEAKGQTIPENDLWIAAVALECDLPLATRDAHFERVDGVTIIRW